MQLRNVTLVAASHLCIDITQGALPALLPYLLQSRHLSYSSAGGLIFAGSVASSIVQPVFGYYSDRFSQPWLMPAGLALAGICMSLIGLVPGYWTMVLVVAVCGLGVAAFHPEGARQINRLSGRQKATAMSLFSMGGNLGFAVGPALVTLLLWLDGLRGTIYLMVPCLAMAVVLLPWLRVLTRSQEAVAPAATGTHEQQRDAWLPFVFLSLAVIFRSIVFYGLLMFIPAWWIHRLGQSTASSGAILTLFIVCGVIGTFIGGRLADRYGYLTLLRTGFVLLLPLLFLLMLIPPVPAAVAIVALIGLIYYAPFSTMVVLGQQYLPNRVGLASGVTLGLAVSIGGAATPFLGKLADRHGIVAAVTVIAILPVLVLLTALFLPAPGSQAGRQRLPVSGRRPAAG